jgi:Ribbon-helix-helix protein, copG family
MCMAQLTRRTQILLDEERYRRLEERASETGRSVASLIRDAIDAQFEDDDQARRRREAGQALLAEPMPNGYDREPDWEDVKDDAVDERWRRLYPDAE